MTGVQFRQGYAVGFRQVILDNIDEVMDRKDWPDMGAAARPERYVKEDVEGWEGRWGRDRPFNEKWNLAKKKRVPERKQAIEFIKTAARQEVAKKYAEYEPKVQPTIDRIERYYNEAPVEVKAKVKEYTDKVVEAVEAPTPSSKKKAYALNEYALTLMEMKKYDLALNYFNKAIALDPTEETYRTNKARCIDWIDYRDKQGGN
jgi:tetratricopeptide (TPR) repeat protein